MDIEEFHNRLREACDLHIGTCLQSNKAYEDNVGKLFDQLDRNTIDHAQVRAIAKQEMDRIEMLMSCAQIPGTVN